MFRLLPTPLLLMLLSLAGAAAMAISAPMNGSY